MGPTPHLAGDVHPDEVDVPVRWFSHGGARRGRLTGARIPGTDTLSWEKESVFPASRGSKISVHSATLSKLQIHRDSVVTLAGACWLTHEWQTRLEATTTVGMLYYLKSHEDGIYARVLGGRHCV